MYALLAVLTVLLGISASFAIFFGSEYKRKTETALAFFEGAFKVVVHWEYPGAAMAGIPIGMHNIVLSADKPFKTMIGIKIKIPLLGLGYDPMRTVTSRPDDKGRHIVVLNTYLARGAVGWRFAVDEPNATYTVALNPPDCGEPTTVCPPHWFQRLGIFA